MINIFLMKDWKLAAIALNIMPTILSTITIMTSRSSVIDVAANGVLCAQSLSLIGLQSTTINYCNYRDGDFIEVSIKSTDFTSQPGFIAHFTLTDTLGQSYNTVTSEDWFCNFYPSVLVDYKFPNNNLNTLNPDASWIWDISNSNRVVCFYQLSYFYYITAQVNIDNFFDAFEIRDANGVTKYRWDVPNRESGDAWPVCRNLKASVKIDNGDWIYIEGAADTWAASSVYDGSTGLNALITIQRGLRSYSVATSAGSTWLCADNYNKSRWGGNNNNPIGAWGNSVASGMANRCNLGNSIWNMYSAFVVCKYQVQIIPSDPDENYP